MRTAARETGTLLKADGRRENIESVEAMRKRGLKVHTLTPELDAQWDQVVATTYPKVRGTAVPADIYDQIITELKNFRATKSK
jgi:TRAP-type C4-dicarboxylate transport system substrate-binding protein